LVAPPPAGAAGPVFTQVIGFATKTGFRGVVAWEADSLVDGAVRYGTTEDGSGWQVVQPTVGAPDTAGMAVLEPLETGTTYYFQVFDEATGVASGVQTLEAKNAYTDWDEASQSYTIDMLVQLDAEDLPPEVPGDQALADLAQGLSVFAERVYDATDRHVRIGNVLVTDTNLDYSANIPFLGPNAPPGCEERGGNLADVLVQTTVPADSHTWAGWAIDQPCTSFYVGRLGWLRVPTFMWEDDLDFASVAAHELAHYAFNSPDLYDPGNLTQSAPNYDDDQPFCKNLDWDGSLMHNSSGWNATLGRWELTELDRNPQLTPCDHGSEPWSWDVLRERYDKVPLNPLGPIDHVVDNLARGNDDGGALNIKLLDRTPGSSTLSGFDPDDSSPPPPPPPPPCSAGLLLTDAVGDATGLAGENGLAPNEPALDVIAARATFDPNTAALTFTVDVDDLQATPPAASTGDQFRIPFTYGGKTYQVRAERQVGVPLRTSFYLWQGVQVPVYGAAPPPADIRVPVQGSFDAENDTVTIVIPSREKLAGAPATAPTWTGGEELSGVQVDVRRLVTAPAPAPPTGLGPQVDLATSHCPYRLGEELYPGNRPPAASPDAVVTAEDTSATFSPMANDSDPDGDPLKIVATTGGRGSVQIQGGSITYRPAPNFTGTDSFRYTVTDGKFMTGSALVTVDVTPVNDPVVAGDDTTAGAQGQTLSIPVLANDTDIDGDRLAVTSVSGARFGTASITGTTVTYRPNELFTGRERLSYVVSDGKGTTDTATVEIVVVPEQCVSTLHENAEHLPVTPSAWTSDGKDSLFLWSAQPDPSATTPTQSWFFPAADFGATAWLTSPPINVMDGTQLSFDHRYLFYGVLGSYTEGGVLEVSADGGRTWSDAGGLITNGGYDAEIGSDSGSSLAGRRAWTGASSGPGYPAPPDAMERVEADLSPYAGRTVQLRWVVGTDFYIDAHSAGWWVDTIEVSRRINDGCVVSTPPAAVNDAAATDEDLAVAIDVLANDGDLDGDKPRVVEVSRPASGSAAIAADGRINYTPDTNFHGVDSFTYTIADPSGARDSAVVVVTVRPVNDAPIAAMDSGVTHEDTPVTLSVLENDSDPDGDQLRVVAVDDPAHGEARVVDGGIAYTPDLNFNGVDRLRYTIADPSGATSSAEAFVQVAAVNDKPVAEDDFAQVGKNRDAVIAVLANDTDVDGDSLAVGSVGRAANGSVTVQPDGRIRYVARKGFTGVDSFAYSVHDGAGGIDTAVVTVTVGK
jgi:hypothetical protein